MSLLQMKIGSVDDTQSAPNTAAQKRSGIRLIKLRDLDDFVRETLADETPGAVVPISRTRAGALLRNPYADPDDVALIVAYRDRRCIGYLTLVPGLFAAASAVQKVYRLSACYVPPDQRAGGAGGLLMLRAMTLRYDLVATGFSAEVTPIYERLRFKPIGPLRYRMADFRFACVPGLALRVVRKLLRRAGVNVAAVDRAVDVADRVCKRMVYAFLNARMGSALGELSLKTVTAVSDTPYKTPDPTKAARFVRGADEINWMLHDRWVATDKDAATPGYYFGDYDPEFDYVALELRERHSDRYRGRLVMRRDTTGGRRNLTLFDCDLIDDADRRVIMPIVMREAGRYLADVIKLPAMTAAPKLGWLDQWLFRAAERPYFFYSASRDSLLARNTDAVTLNLADGDVSFA